MKKIVVTFFAFLAFDSLWAQQILFEKETGNSRDHTATQLLEHAVLSNGNIVFNTKESTKLRIWPVTFMFNKEGKLLYEANWADQSKGLDNSKSVADIQNSDYYTVVYSLEWGGGLKAMANVKSQFKCLKLGADGKRKESKLFDEKECFVSIFVKDGRLHLLTLDKVKIFDAVYELSSFQEPAGQYNLYIFSSDLSSNEKKKLNIPFFEEEIRAVMYRPVSFTKDKLIFASQYFMEEDKKFSIKTVLTELDVNSNTITNEKANVMELGTLKPESNEFPSRDGLMNSRFNNLRHVTCIVNSQTQDLFLYGPCKGVKSSKGAGSAYVICFNAKLEKKWSTIIPENIAKATLPFVQISAYLKGGNLNLEMPQTDSQKKIHVLNASSGELVKSEIKDVVFRWNPELYAEGAANQAALKYLVDNYGSFRKQQSVYVASCTTENGILMFVHLAAKEKLVVLKF